VFSGVRAEPPPPAVSAWQTLVQPYAGLATAGAPIVRSPSTLAGDDFPRAGPEASGPA
jgi:hypothetical protein